MTFLILYRFQQQTQKNARPVCSPEVLPNFSAQPRSNQTVLPDCPAPAAPRHSLIHLEYRSEDSLRPVPPGHVPVPLHGQQFLCPNLTLGIELAHRSLFLVRDAAWHGPARAETSRQMPELQRANQHAGNYLVADPEASNNGAGVLPPDTARLARPPLAMAWRSIELIFGASSLINSLLSLY